LLALGCTLMQKPHLLLLDEPTAGLAPRVRAEIFEHIDRINQLGIGVLIVEHNARMALSLSDRGYVLVGGRKRLEDTGKDLLDNERVSELFLGG